MSAPAKAPLRVIRLGSGRVVRLSAYARAWRMAISAPADQRVRELPCGYSGTAGEALCEFRAGMHDRINRHLPEFGRGRKWEWDWQGAARRAAYALIVGARIERDAPKEIRARLPHRVRGAD